MGYTRDDIKQSFAPYLKRMAAQLSLSEEELLDKLTACYGGYCFDYDAKVQLFNPWSINNFFNQWDLDATPRFSNFWINATRSPVLLKTLMQRARITYADLVASYDHHALLPYRALAATEHFSQATFLPWLACNGYLTIKQDRPPIAYQPDQRTFCCGCPNTEVAQSLGWAFFQYAVATQLIRVTLPRDLAAALAAGDIAQICQYLN